MLKSSLEHSIIIHPTRLFFQSSIKYRRVLEGCSKLLAALEETESDGFKFKLLDAARKLYSERSRIYWMQRSLDHNEVSGIVEIHKILRYIIWRQLWFNRDTNEVSTSVDAVDMMSEIWVVSRKQSRARSIRGLWDCGNLLDCGTSVGCGSITGFTIHRAIRISLGFLFNSADSLHSSRIFL